MARFVEQAQDISNGVRELLMLLEWDDVEQESVDNRQRLLSPTSVCHLRRLAIAALEGMATKSERTLDWMLKQAQEAGARP